MDGPVIDFDVRAGEEVEEESDVMDSSKRL